MKSIVCGPGEGETVTNRPERTIRILIDHEFLVVTWTRYEPGERGPDPHVHRRHVDCFHVLRGELVFGLGPEVEAVRAPAGTFVAVPQNVAHTFANESREPAYFLNFHAPNGGFAESLRGRREGFDSFDPPEDGGRAASLATVSRPGEGERIEGEGRVNLIKADLPEISAFELAVDASWDGIGTHDHGDHVDSFFVLEGDAEFAVEDGFVRASAGSFVAAPLGARHGIRNLGEGRTVFLNVHAPDAGFAGRVRSR